VASSGLIKRTLKSESKHIYIRADADTQIGSGHLMRCLALAQAWKELGGIVTFISACESESLKVRVSSEGFELIPIEKPYPDPDDLNSTLEVRSAMSHELSNTSPWLVLDGYHFTSDYQKTIREKGYKLMVIDDMAHLDHYHANILLNQNIHASGLNYSCDRDTVKLLGCDYILFRSEFLKYQGWKREIPGKAKKILVTMGGSDPDNVTLKVIRALNSLSEPHLEVKIVVGPANPNIDSLEKELSISPSSFQLLPKVGNMPELMAWADMAVSAGGSTCWELAFMGLPAILIVTGDNQIGLAAGLGEIEVVNNLGWFSEVSIVDISRTVNSLGSDKKLRKKMSQQGNELVDGEGFLKIINAMKQAAN
jgi:UDP-2,4-diacetamido-2,4,6-trideoxy-beta-L-altropyranose hydrolase